MLVSTYPVSEQPSNEVGVRVGTERADDGPKAIGATDAWLVPSGVDDC